MESNYISKDTLVGEVRKLLCALCRRRTNHGIVKSIQDDWVLDAADIQGKRAFLIVQCRGCDTFSFSKESSDSETYHDVEMSDGTHESFYPTTEEQFPKVNTDYQSTKTYYSMPFEIREAYEETYRALMAGLFKLGAAGMRLVVELVCLTEGIISGNLKERVDALQNKGVVTETMAQLLHNVRLFGNENLHTTKTPRTLELISGWDAINTMLNAVYGAQDFNKHYDTKKTGSF